MPYKSGNKTPSGIAAVVLVGTALAFWPGVWLASAYLYHYDNPYRYYNVSSQANETRNIICGCAAYAVCGCDENNSTAYYQELIGNGSYASLNKTIVNVAEYQGNMTILINGTLPNGTTAAAADSAAGDSLRSMAEAAGFWPVISLVLATVFLG